MDEMDVAEEEEGIPLKQQHLFLDQAKAYNFVAVRDMIEATPGLVNVQPSMRWSALHQAAEAGDEGAVRFLLEKGANQNLKTKDGRTALQVAKNASIRALLGGGEKRSAEMEGAGAKAAKAAVAAVAAAPAAPAVELELKVHYAASGAELVSLKWPSDQTVEALQEELRKHLESGQIVQSLLKENYPLTANQTLRDAGVETGTSLNAVIDAVPTLFLFEPCSAEKLCEKYEGWSAIDDAMVTSQREHLPMDKAPEVAREVAKEIKEAAPDLGTLQICCSSEGDAPGEVVVISKPGEDPKKACLKALLIVKECEEDLGEQDENDPEMSGLWSVATLEKVEWKNYLGLGFNKNADAGDHEASEEQILKATKIMDEKLQNHFIFNFSDEAVVAPVIYGGYASDGSIVGVLSCRVWT